MTTPRARAGGCRESRLGPPRARIPSSLEPEATPAKMWLKLFFLLLYFLVLFCLARFFEAIVWYETGIFATQLVDPVALSFKKLKTILECRGLGYSGLPEKKDVRELVEKSGEYGAGCLGRGRPGPPTTPCPSARDGGAPPERVRLTPCFSLSRSAVDYVIPNFEQGS